MSKELNNLMKPKKQRGTHALRKRCPLCKKLRRFCDTPSDLGGTRDNRKGWHKIENRWCCPFCTSNLCTSNLNNSND